MQILLQDGTMFAAFQNPLLMLLLGIFVVVFAFMGTRAARGPATSTPFMIILLIGLVMIFFALLGMLA
jgi:hypothetical protein